MAEVTPITSYILPEEKAIQLTEGNRKDILTEENHRIQRIYVVREDRMAVHERDMGSSKSFNAEPLVILGAVWDDNGKVIDIPCTVDELIHMADEQREVQDFSQLKAPDLALATEYLKYEGRENVNDRLN